MSWSRHVTLWCDYDGGIEAAMASDPVEVESRHVSGGPSRGCVIWTDHGRAGVEETRHLARQQGWRYVESKDLCPDHVRMDPDGRALLEREAMR